MAMNNILKMQAAALATENTVLRAQQAALKAEIAAKDRELSALRCYVAQCASDIEYVELKDLVTTHYDAPQLSAPLAG